MVPLEELCDVRVGAIAFGTLGHGSLRVKVVPVLRGMIVDNGRFRRRRLVLIDREVELNRARRLRSPVDTVLLARRGDAVVGKLRQLSRRYHGHHISAC